MVEAEFKKSVIYLTNSNIKLFYLYYANCKRFDFFEKRGVKVVKKDFL